MNPIPEHRCQSKVYTCKECKQLLFCYFQGNDCWCGTIDLCDKCYLDRHKVHDVPPDNYKI